MAPPTKKVKTEPTAIIFTTPGQKPDVRFVVFNQSFHVSSGILKLSSSYFRKFFEPGHGISPTPSTSVFQPEWFTVIDDDGSWALNSSATTNTNIAKFKGVVSEEQSAFHKFLCALFSRRYVVQDVAELKRITQLADYYCALPSLSFSLDGSLHRDTGFIDTISSDPCSTLLVAIKLRNELLFRDSIIHVLSPWNNPPYLKLKDTEPLLFERIDKLRIEMTLKIFQIQTQIFEHISQNNTIHFEEKISMERRLSVIQFGRLLYPKYLRQCRTLLGSEPGKGVLTLCNFLDLLLDNKLALDKKKLRAGEGQAVDSFLSFEIEDLPWDVTQTDW